MTFPEIPIAVSALTNVVVSVLFNRTNSNPFIIMKLEWASDMKSIAHSGFHLKIYLKNFLQSLMKFKVYQLRQVFN